MFFLHLKSCLEYWTRPFWETSHKTWCFTSSKIWSWQVSCLFCWLFHTLGLQPFYRDLTSQAPSISVNQAQEIAKRMGCQLQRRDPFGEIIIYGRGVGRSLGRTMTFEAFEHDRKMPMMILFFWIQSFFFSEASRATQEDIFLYRWHLIPRGIISCLTRPLMRLAWWSLVVKHLNTVDPTKSCINGSSCNIKTIYSIHNYPRYLGLRYFDQRNNFEYGVV